jgi:hypothetical protein
VVDRRRSRSRFTPSNVTEVHERFAKIPKKASEMADAEAQQGAMITPTMPAPFSVCRTAARSASTSP